MIKNHKPRGYQWTNASTFQQTEDFKHIDQDECRALPSMVLYRGSDEDMSDTERASKKRRIETLASDFLNGKPLRIASARPCPREVRRTIVWNKKSSDEPKFVLDATRRAGSGEILTDVEEVPRLWDVASARMPKAGQNDVGDHIVRDTEVVTDETVIEEQVVASCERQRPPRLLELASRPSDDALRQAAVLRQRRLQMLENEATTKGQRDQVDDRLNDQGDGNYLPSPVPDAVDPMDQALFWQGSHKLDMNREEQSLDELRLSNTDTPARQVKPLDMAARAQDRRRQRSLASTPEQSSSVQETLSPSATASSSDLIPSHDTATDRYAATTSSADGATIRRPVVESGVDVVTPQPRALQTSSLSRGSLHQGPRVYAVEQNGKSNSTPFMFRRRDSRSVLGQSTNGKKAGTRKPPFLASTAQTRGRTLMSSPLKAVTADPLTSTFEDQRSTSEPPTCATNVPAKPDAHERSQFWPGTQVLLYQAQHDLFTSPAKASRVDEEHFSPPASVAEMSLAASSRRAGRSESQEQLPSTQALLANFDGFSTVKKPYNAYRDSPLPTPTARGRHESQVATKASPDESTDKGTESFASRLNRRSSGLRFAISADSPVQSPSASQASHNTPTAKFPISEPVLGAKSTLNDSSNESQTDDSLPTNPLPLFGHENISQHSVTTPEISSLSHRQPSYSFTNDDSLSQTMNELTRDVLGVGDLDGVLSQA